MNGREVFSGNVTGEPRPTHPEDRVHNEWRERQYRARLQTYFLQHAYPPLAELEVARRVGHGREHLARLQAYWELPRAARNQTDVVSIARTKRRGSK